MTQERLAGWEGEVVQTDRDAAAAWMRGLEDFQEIGAGSYGDLVQAFARHRLAAIEECAIAARNRMVAQEWPPTDGDQQIDEVLEAIRSLAPPPAVVGETSHG